MEINDITLSDVLPRVFEQCPPAHSDVWGTDLRLHRGAYYLIEAESGAGKSSLCSFIYGARHDYKGTIRFDGTDISAFSLSKWCEIRRTSMALLPQEMRIFPELTALENIQLKNSLTRHRSSEQIMLMMQALEIDNKAHTPAALLSIGQQQRVAIVRALCQPFSFLLLDEPVSHLDRRNNLAAARLILQAANEQNAAIIATSVGNPILLEADLTAIKL